MASVWDNQEIEREVVDLWNEKGWSALVIARHVNAKYGDGKALLSRNSVVAKAHRLRAQGVKMRGRPLVRGSATTKVRKIRIRKLGLPSRPDGQQPPTRLALAIRAAPFRASVDHLVPTVFSVGDLEVNHCRWVYSSTGEPGFGFCGRDRFMGLSYCATHSAKAFQAPVIRSQTPEAAPVPAIVLDKKLETA